MDLSKHTRMPALFVGHGSPMNALADNRYTQALRQQAQRMPRPSAVLCVSAHWYTHCTSVTAMPKPKTIHDFGGFPKALFDIEYPAPGDPQLADKVQSLLAPMTVPADFSWGLDHGAWQVLVHLYQQADIPVIQLSIDATQSPHFHYDLGRRLAPLRDAGVLLLGSGNIVHNLRRMQRADDAPPFDWASRFAAVVRTAVLARDHDSLINFGKYGEDARLSVPTPEHYLPLLYILGAQAAAEQAQVFVEGIENGSLDMMSFSV